MFFVGLINDSFTNLDDHMKALLSVFGNTLNKAKFTLVTRESDANQNQVSIVSKSFYYSGGSVQMVINNYQLLKSKETLPFQFDVVCNTDKMFSKFVGKSNIFVGFPGDFQTIADIVKILEKCDKPIYLFNHNHKFDTLISLLNDSQLQSMVSIYDDLIELINDLNQLNV